MTIRFFGVDVLVSSDGYVEEGSEDKPSASVAMVVIAAHAVAVVVRYPECNENGLVFVSNFCRFCCEEETAIVEPRLSELVDGSGGQWMFSAIFYRRGGRS